MQEFWRVITKISDTNGTTIQDPVSIKANLIPEQYKRETDFYIVYYDYFETLDKANDYIDCMKLNR